MADTPSPGKIRLVKAGDNLQQALDAANCGETIKLEAGGNFVGRFRLENKHCDDAHWIFIRTSASDERLPPEGTRITPCYAGVASLPDRPDFHCSNPNNVMARITFDGKGGPGPILFAAGASHYRMMGLELTREESDASVTELAGPEERAPIDRIVFDRVWLHGTANGETRRGIFLSGATHTAIVDSYFSDFHCVAGTGSCVDSQAISGGTGDLPMGPYRIVNNFLEAAGENILFGGGEGSTTPADIEIRHNHFYKPAIWMRNHGGFVGGTSGHPFIVKNLFELKNAQRVLFEGNVLENSWGGFSQKGFGIVLTPKNQSNNCPLCRVTDITIAYDTVSHIGTGLQIVNGRSAAGGTSTAGERYSIHDVVFDDIDGAAYDGFGFFALLISMAPPLRDIKIDHVSAFPPGDLLTIRADENRFENFTFTNNLLSSGKRQIASSGGGPANCAFHADQFGPTTAIKNCFISSSFSHNVIIGGADWPSGNFTPKNPSETGIAGRQNGRAVEYRLCKAKQDPDSCKSESKFVHAGTDGKDIGPDWDALGQAIDGAI